MKEYRYRGMLIKECQWIGHSDRWIIQEYHADGRPWEDRYCFHAHSLTSARQLIREIKAGEELARRMMGVEK